MEENRCNLTVIRRLRDVAYHLRDTYKTIVIVAPMLRLPPELAKDVTVLEFGLPGPDDFNALLDRIIEDVKDKPTFRIDLDADGRERLLQAAQGLTLKEAENVFAKTMVLDGKLDAEDVTVVFSEKQQIIRKSGLLEYYETHEQLDNVAGLEKLKEWLVKRGLAFTERAVEFGLPAPRGVLLLGVQGCGKSLCAKAASSLWKLPLLRFDIGRMFGSLVGSSEENMRRAIQTAESIAPVVLWVDEIDKAFGGASDSGGSDGGTAARVFGTFLTWLVGEVQSGIRHRHGQRHQPVCRRNCSARVGSMRSSSSICPASANGSTFSASICCAAAVSPISSTWRSWPGAATASAAPRSRRPSSPACTTPSAGNRSWIKRR